MKIISFIIYLLLYTSLSFANSNSNTFDASGNAINSFVTGPRRGLSVNVENLVGISSSAGSPIYATPAYLGSPIDPRSRTWNLVNTSDSAQCYQGGTWNIFSKLKDSSGTGLTSTLVSAKQGLDVNIIGSTLSGGDASAANQTTEIARLTSILSALGSTLTTSTTGTVTANIGTYSGIASDSTVSAMSAKIPTLGQHATSGSISVVTASDFNPPGPKGRTVIATSRNDYTSTSVDTSSWVQLISSTSGIVNEVEIFDSSGQTLELGTGGSGSESRLILIFPGGNGRVSVVIPASTRISIRAVSATANAGENDINFYN